MSTINSKNKKYIKILNNLLEIKGIDSTILSKVNNVDSFDLISKFNIETAKNVLDKKDFNFILEENDLVKLSKELRTAKTLKEVINLFDKYKEPLSEHEKLLLKNKKYLKTLIEKIEEKNQKKNNRWNLFKRKIIDVNTQENVWTLYIASCFISVKTLRNEVYAPLLMKKVDLNLINSNIRLYNLEDSFKINEKVLFILNNSGFKINENINFNSLTFQECLDLIGKELNISINKEDLLFNFKNIDPTRITNKNIVIHPGVVLGSFKPSGGSLRKTMLKIIENNELDSILNIETDKQKLENKMISFIEKKSQSIVKIQPSNYSQDKALSSSLIQDTVIWGPPGTGKSQVIANIIANIFYKNKTAIVVSQKKAALDVLTDRILGLKPFLFFMLNNHKKSLDDFYLPLQKFIHLIEFGGSNREIINEKLISESEIDAIKIISNFKKDSKYKNTLEAVELLKDFDESFIKRCFNINLKFEYPSEIIADLDEFLAKTASLNNIQKSEILHPCGCKTKFWSKKFKESVSSAWNLSIEKNIDLANLRKIVSRTNFFDFQELKSIPKKMIKKNKYISNEKYLIELISYKIFTKIQRWQEEGDKVKVTQFNSFAASVRAGRLFPYRFIRQHLKIIKEIFPVIVTTPETSLIEWKKNHFDYVVIDECSQIHLEVGLPIIYLGKTRIFAGDPKQMRPSTWFMTRDENDDYEEDVVENSDSLLDYALEKGVYQIMLNQNYRSSSAALMAFSSKEFYNSQLEVIDNKRTAKKSPIVTVNVKGKWNKGVNILEAITAIEIAKKAIKKFKKIILLTFNYNQRKLIEKNIISKHPELFKAMENEQIMIRNIENIQGDEADLVIMSVVYDKTTGMSMSYVSRPGGQNALNVAISRAKEKMIVIKSVKGAELKPANTHDFIIFRKWLNFLDLDSELQKTHSVSKFRLQESGGDVDSNFEEDVIEKIKETMTFSKSLKIIKQYPVGSKKIDIVLTDKKDRYLLGIEVDGYKYHEGQGFDKYLDDLSREDFLKSKGYDIFRIKEIDWKINKTEQLNNLKLILDSKLEGGNS